jgi:hypothetical protein
MSDGMNLKPIREALAATIRNGTDQKANCYWSEVEGMQFPMCYVQPHPSQYLYYWGTGGPDGLADGVLQLVVGVEGQDGSDCASQLCDFLSVGQNNPQSIVDAVMRDRTLGGLVDDCVPMRVSSINEMEGTAVIDVKVLFKKLGAEA